MKEKRDSAITHKIMSSIPSKNTKPEIALRKALWHRNLRYRVNYRKLPGTPDIVFTKHKIAVFCDGDYWHGHNWAIRGYQSIDEELSNYSDYWKNKITNNINRDSIVTHKLEELGWTVIRVWESEIKENVESCAQIIIAAINNKQLDSYKAKEEVNNNDC